MTIISIDDLHADGGRLTPSVLKVMTDDGVMKRR